MTAAALSGDHRIGMVAVKPDPLGDGTRMEGDPEVFPVGCAGKILRSEPIWLDGLIFKKKNYCVVGSPLRIFITCSTI